MEMTSSVPYLLRALYQWILDNGCTPYIVVDADTAGTSVPLEYVEEGRIVLNIAPSAVRDLSIEDDAIRFTGRFAGVATPVTAPIASVAAIYARENGHGMWFPRETGSDQPPPDTPSPPGAGGDRPTLRIVK